MSAPLLQRTPIRDRAERPATIWNFTLGELFSLVGIGAADLWILGFTKPAALVLIAAFAWFRYVKEMIPPNYIRNFIYFYLSEKDHYSAAVPDSEWVPPVLDSDR